MKPPVLDARLLTRLMRGLQLVRFVKRGAHEGVLLVPGKAANDPLYWPGGKP